MIVKDFYFPSDLFFIFFHVLLLQLENLLKINKVPFGNLY